MNEAGSFGQQIRLIYRGDRNPNARVMVSYGKGRPHNLNLRPQWSRRGLLSAVIDGEPEEWPSDVVKQLDERIEAHCAYLNTSLGVHKAAIDRSSLVMRLSDMPYIGQPEIRIDLTIDGTVRSFTIQGPVVGFVFFETE